MVLSLIVYGCLIIVMSFCGQSAVNDRRNSFFYVAISILFFTLLSGLRYQVGVDYPSYLDEYLRLQSGEGFSRDFELGFTALSKILSGIGFSFPYYFALWAFLQISVMYFALRNFKEIYQYIPVTLFFTLTFLMWYNGIRQCIAVMFWLCSLQYIDKKSFFKFILCIFCGYLFHKSIIVLVLFYFILVSVKDYFKSIKLQYILVAIGVGMSFLLTSFDFDGLFNQYALVLGYGKNIDLEEKIGIALEEGRLGWGPRRILMLIVNLIVIKYSSEMKSFFPERYKRYFTILYNVSFLGVVLGVTFFKIHIITRFILYFDGVHFVVYAFFLYYISKVYKHSVVKLIVIFLLLLYFMVNLYSGQTGGNVGKFLYNFIPL